MVFGSPEKIVINALSKIEKGHGNQKLSESLKKALMDNPELIEDAASRLIGLIQTDRTESFGYAIDVLLTVVEMDPDLLANSSEAIVRIIEKSEDTLAANDILKAMDILSIMSASHSELMEPAVPVLLKKLNSRNSRIRSASYYILDIIARPHPDFFSRHNLALIRCLHGLDVDERVYAAKLIGEIFRASPDIVDESYETLKDLAYKHPDNKVRMVASDVIKKFNVVEKEETVTKESEEEMLEFEKDFIGIEEIKSDDNDFEALADDLAQRITGIDFESSASELLNSMGMGHLIVSNAANNGPSETMLAPEATIKPVNNAIAAEKVIKPAPLTPKAIEEKILKQPQRKAKNAPEYAFKRLEQIVSDPRIKPRLSPVKDITMENEGGIQAKKIITADNNNNTKNLSAAESLISEQENQPETGGISDITVEMLSAIFAEISKEDWVINVGLTTRDGSLIAAADPDSIEKSTITKIIDMLSLEAGFSKKDGSRNRVRIELTDKLLVAMSIDIDYIMIMFTRSDIQIEKLQYNLNRTADKIEKIIR